MSKFNLRFWGEILPGKDPAQVKQRFAKLFGIDDPVRLERFFSGDDVILRRNLDLKTAAEYFAKLHKLGVEAELVKVAPETAAEAAARKRRLAEDAARQRAEHDERQRQAAEELARRKAAEEEQRRQAAAEAAKRKAEEEERRRRAAEENARRKAAEEEQRRQAAEAAKRKAEEQERRRRAAEENARRKAAEEEQRRQAAEEAAKRKAEEQERRRRAAEEHARRKAAEEEQRRQAAEEAAKRKAEEEERRRRAAEENARRKAEEEEKRRQAAEEAARRAKEQAERKRRAAEEAARREAERQERRRKAAEEAARRKAEARQRQRREDEEKARLQAERERRQREEKARQQAEREVAQRRAAAEAGRRREQERARKRKAEEEAARRRQEEEERRRREAEERARRDAEREAAAQRQREHEARIRREAAEKAAAEAASQREEQRRAAAEAARARAEKEAAKRRRAEQAARDKAEAQRRRQEEQAAQAAERQAMEAQAIARGAAALNRQGSVRPSRSGVRTTLPLPPRRPGDTAPPPRRRQPGEPNFYALEPFRNTPEVQGRAARSRQRMKRAFQLAMAMLALLLVVAVRYLSLSPPAPVTGPAAMAIQPGAGPLLLAGGHLLFHDRSGTGTEELTPADLGLLGLAPPMVFAQRDQLLARGRLPADGTAGEGWSLLRCDLPQSRCGAFSPGPGDYQPDAIAVHPITGEVFVADARAGEILKFDGEGALLARAAAPVPAEPVLHLDSGLLFINSAEGPAIGVFRYENEAFAQQLDEVLLLPPAAVNTGQSRLGDFVRVGDFWWAYLYNPDDGNGDLFRFDADWAFVDEVPLPHGVRAQQLAAWNGRLLVSDPMHKEIQRFAGTGAPEAPLASDLLLALAAEREQTARFGRLLWRGALALGSLLAAAALGAALFLRLRAMVYRTSRERGAEPADELLDRIRWVDPVADRDARLRRLTRVYLFAATVALATGVAFTVDAPDLLALLLALAGPALALALLRREGTGHIGAVDGQLLLVDHRNVYHLGGGSRVQYRRHFLLIDDVVVFTGSRWLPAFSPEQVQALVAPLRAGGVRVDRGTIAIKLLQGRHALAVGALAVATGVAAALALVSLHHL